MFHLVDTGINTMSQPVVGGNERMVRYNMYPEQTVNTELFHARRCSSLPYLNYINVYYILILITLTCLPCVM